MDALTDKELMQELRAECLRVAARLNVEPNKVVALAREFEDYVTGRSDDQAKTGGP